MLYEQVEEREKEDYGGGLKHQPELVSFADR